jgi:hypothetical protein
MIFWYENTSDAAGDYRIFIIMLNDICESLTVEPFMSPLPPLARCVPRQGGKRHRRKRMQFFVKTLQGTSYQTQWEVKQIAQYLKVPFASCDYAVPPSISAAASAVSSSSGTAGQTSYVSLSSLPSLALAAPATAVAKGSKLGRKP